MNILGSGIAAVVQGISFLIFGFLILAAVASLFQDKAIWGHVYVVIAFFIAGIGRAIAKKLSS